MPFRIRTKLITAFISVLLPILVLFVFNHFQLKALHKSVLQVEDIANEMSRLSDLNLSIEMMLMPANDYLITGDIKERESFYKHLEEVESHFPQLSERKVCRGCHGDKRNIFDKLLMLEIKEDWPEEMRFLKRVRDGVERIKEQAEDIFSLKSPIGNASGAKLMEEMDATAHELITKDIAGHKEADAKTLNSAILAAERAKGRYIVIRTVGYLIVVVLAVFFALFYSRLFTVPIKKLHDGADAIAGGDFKTRVDIKTGDELEQLADGMNEMAAQLDAFYGTLEDQVIERTRELKASEERLRNLTETTSDWVWEVNGNGVFTYSSPQIREILGYDPEEVLGKTPFDFMRPEEARRVAEFFRATAATQQPFKFFENLTLHKDGHEVVVETSGVPYFGAEEKFIGYHGINRDITERKKTEEVLKESEERFRTVTNTAGDAIICLEAPGNIKFWNKKAVEMFGYAADEVTGRDMHDLIVPEKYLEKARKGLKVFFQTGAGSVVGKTVELTALRKDGTEFHIALSISAMKIHEKWQATGIIRDITERKKAEQELAKHVDELERYMKATVQREFRIKELRDRVEELEKGLKG